MLNEKCALVTGATQGIGLAITHEMAGTGCAIVLHGVETEEEGRAIAAGVAERHGVRTAYVRADLSCTAEAEALVLEAERSLASIDILINNAGIQFTSPAESFPLDRWHALELAHHQRAAAMRAGIVNDIQRAVHVEHGQGQIALAHDGTASPCGQLVRRNHKLFAHSASSIEALIVNTLRMPSSKTSAGCAPDTGSLRLNTNKGTPDTSSSRGLPALLAIHASSACVSKPKSPAMSSRVARSLRLPARTE